jgi:hypothetical protein
MNGACGGACGSRPRAKRCVQIVCVGFTDEIVVPSASSILARSARLFSSLGKADADALRAAARGVRRRDPADLAGDRIALRIVRKRQQQVDVLGETVIARRRHEDAALGEHRM